MLPETGEVHLFVKMKERGLFPMLHHSVLS